LGSIDGLVQKILAIGLYQLRFLDRIPARAAIDEAVEQTRRFGRKSAAGLVNAVLRNATREPDPADQEVDPAIRLSHPEELVKKLAKLLDDRDEAIAFCRRDNAEPPTILQLAEGVDVSSVSAPGVAFSLHESGHPAYVVAGAKHSHFALWSSKNLAHVQDPTAAAVASFMRIERGMSVLDRCAGVGTKTLQISRLVGPGGKVFAMDPNPDRCALLRSALISRNVNNVGVVEAEWVKEASHVLPARFDRVLIDAPCSNSGVLPRRAEARFRQDKATLKSLIELQRKVLFDTFDSVAAGGLLIYSTCSIWPEENEILLERVFTERRDFSVLSSVTTFPAGDASTPTAYHDGGFVAVMQRFAARRS